MLSRLNPLALLPLLTLLSPFAEVHAFEGDAPPRPNIVLIYADDLGYADIGPFGAKWPTPNLDRVAREGRRFTSFYVAQAVCSASRTALLTGCYPNRLSILGALGPNAPIGIDAGESTIAEVLAKGGYTSAVFGKWHLGDAPEFLPPRHGFSEYLGLPYSNDMWPNHPRKKDFPSLPLIEGDKVVEIDPDQSQLTRRYTERAVRFIESHRDQPFFLYLPQTMPHVPLFASDAYRGKTGQGLYADVVAEIDWSVGQILDALERTGVDQKTLLIFTSDNGPWLSYGDHAGSAGRFREGKGTSFEGGVRVPCLMRWPGRIPAGSVCDEPAMTIDILPTLAALAGVPLPDRPIDGQNIAPLVFAEAGARSPHEAFYFYWARGLEAVRSGRWKLHLRHDYQALAEPGGNGQPGRYEKRTIGPALFDLESDPGETTDVHAQNPEIVARLESLAERARADLGDSLTGREGTGVRPPGRRTSPPRPPAAPRAATP